MSPVLSKKNSWSLLISFFTFDSFVSYWAIVYRQAHEANPVIASSVEKFPLLYFALIPVLIPIVYFIFIFFSAVAYKLFPKIQQNYLDKVILTALVIYWLLGNSSINLIYLLGYKLPADIWYLTAPTSTIPAILFSFIIIKKGTPRGPISTVG